MTLFPGCYCDVQFIIFSFRGLVNECDIQERHQIKYHIKMASNAVKKSDAVTKKLLDNLQTDLRQLSSDCKRKFPPVKEVCDQSMQSEIILSQFLMCILCGFIFDKLSSEMSQLGFVMMLWTSSENIK